MLLKELIKEINTLNQILLSSHIGENLRNTPIDRADTEKTYSWNEETTSWDEIT